MSCLFIEMKEQPDLWDTLYIAHVDFDSKIMRGGEGW